VEEQTALHNGRIALLDAGAQYKQLIARVLREQGAEVDVHPIDAPPEHLSFYDGIVISGGPRSVTEQGAPRCHEDVFRFGVPILGICYGMQLGNLMLGGKVGPLSGKEYGEIKATVEQNIGVLGGIDEKVQRVLMSHGDSLIELAPGMQRIAYTTTVPPRSRDNREG
jgi:GMP synthase (glutamine-hydrolysing)